MNDPRNDPDIPTLTERSDLPAPDTAAAFRPVSVETATVEALAREAAAAIPAPLAAPSPLPPAVDTATASAGDTQDDDIWRAQVRQEIERALRPAVDAALDSLRRRLERELPALVAAAVAQHARKK